MIHGSSPHETGRSRTPSGAFLTRGVGVLAACALLWQLWRQVRTRAALNYDDGVYVQTLLAVGDGRRLYDEVFQAQPPGFIGLFALPVRLGLGVDGARALMLAVWVGQVVLAGLLARRLAGPAAAWLAAAVVIALPLSHAQALMIGADVPTAAGGTAAVLAALRAGDATGLRSRVGWAAASGALLVATTTVKVSALTLAPAVLVALLLVPGPRSARLPVLAGAAGGAGAAGLIAVALFRPDALMWDQVVTFHTDAAATGFRGDGTGALLQHDHVWLLGVWAAAVLACLVAAALLLPRSPGASSASPMASPAPAAWAAVATVVVGSAVFALRFQPFFVHQLLVYLPAVAAAAAAGAVLIVDAVLARRRPGAASRGGTPRRPVTLMLAFGVAVVTSAAVAVRDVTPPPTSSVLACLSALDLRGPVVTDDQPMLTQAGLRTPPGLADTSSVRILARRLNRDEVDRGAQEAVAAVVARPGRFSLRMKGTVEMLQERWPVVVDVRGYRVLLPAGTTVPARCR